MIRTLFLGLLAALAAGCAAVPTATPEEDGSAKFFSPQPDLAALYVFRSEFIGAASAMGVSVNGVGLGQTGAQSYFRVDLRPGNYRIDSHAENISSLSLAAEAGRNYFVWQEVKMGAFRARAELLAVDEAQGRAGVMQSRLLQSAAAAGAIAPLGEGGPGADAAVCSEAGTDAHGGTAFQVAPADKALVYLIRPERFMAAAQTYRVSVNGEPAADLRNGSYCVRPMGPGQVRIHAKALIRPWMGPLMIATLGQSELALDAAPGQRYFIDVEVAFSGGPELRLANEEEAKARIKGAIPAGPLEIVKD